MATHPTPSGPATPLEPSGRRAEQAQQVLVDVCVVLPGKGEEVRPGFTLIELTPSGQRASLNHSDLLSPPVDSLLAR